MSRPSIVGARIFITAGYNESRILNWSICKSFCDGWRILEGLGIDVCMFDLLNPRNAFKLFMCSRE